MKEKGYVKSWGRVCLGSRNSKCKGRGKRESGVFCKQGKVVSAIKQSK